MIEALGKLKDIYKGDVTVIELFQYPTIQSLARYLSRKADELYTYQSPSEQEESLVKQLKKGRARQRRQLNKVKSLQVEGTPDGHENSG
jgi:hypothetical protein